MTRDKIYDVTSRFNVSSKKTFKTLIIGKRAIGAVAAAISAVAFCVGFVAMIKSINFTKRDVLEKKYVDMAIPFVASFNYSAQDGKSRKKSNNKSIGVMCVSNIPYFYNIEKANASVSKKNTEVFNMQNADTRKKSEPDKSEYNYGKVTEQSNASVDLDIKNETGYETDKNELIKSYGNIKLGTSDKPQILIVHTHASESYTQSEKYHYSQSDYARCQDIRYNVVRVGDELETELKKKGLNVIHDKTINDYPSYNNSYNKTKELIEKYLKQYPTIKCVFDVHRDAIVRDDDTKVKLTKEINGEKAAQVMLVCGSDASGLYNPNWRENLGFALKIQNAVEKKYPGLMRPVNLRKERFNMHETTGSLLIEFGTHGNTLDEAIVSAKYIAEGICDALL